MEYLTISQATKAHWQILADIEATCFPGEEAATEASIKERLHVYPEGFFIASLNHTIIGFINGGATNTPQVEDSFYGSMKDHTSSGAYLVVFGLNILPDYRGHGYARALLEAFINFGRQEKKSAILLTCKEHLLDFYGGLGFENLGQSASTHGGAHWFEMKLTL